MLSVELSIRRLMTCQSDFLSSPYLYISSCTINLFISVDIHIDVYVYVLYISLSMMMAHSYICASNRQQDKKMKTEVKKWR